ncbi:sugar ABC transporter substrate-binding protein [Salipaludibacillus sp. CF4.18]|uniref:sugar ABC transporter substrate-binding protein n=1 Tax=Salipaludibacillus sp. CF4.18 TaxID=3373081 RepID=UPI003EE4608C
MMKMLFTVMTGLCGIIIMSSCNPLESTEKPVSIEPEAEQSIKDGERLTFAIVYPVAHPFFEGVTLSAKETAENVEKGIDILIRAPAAASVEEQIQIMENLIQQKVDGIAVGPTDSSALTPYINQAIDAGINVICFDTDAPESKRISYIGTDNLAAGKHIGEVVARLLNEEGTIIVSTGLSTMQNLNSRIEGVKNTLKDYPNIEVLDIRFSNGIPSDTITNIENMIEDFPEFDALIGVDSLSGPAAVTVWKAKGLTDKKMVTFDDLPMILDGISNNQISSTISQSQFTWGELIVENLLDSYLGKEVPSFEETETLEVNSKNIDQYINDSKLVPYNN